MRVAMEILETWSGITTDRYIHKNDAEEAMKEYAKECIDEIEGLMNNPKDPGVSAVEAIEIVKNQLK